MSKEELKPILEAYRDYLMQNLKAFPEYEKQAIGLFGSTDDFLKDYDPHEVSYVQCDMCNYKWVAVRPVGTGKLECPNCGYLTNYENL